MSIKIWAAAFIACIVTAGVYAMYRIIFTDGLTTIVSKERAESTNNLTLNSQPFEVYVQEKSVPEPTNTPITKAVEIAQPLKYINKRLGFSPEFRGVEKHLSNRRNR